jgi:flagellin
MALGVLNNISAIYAQNNLSNTQASLSKTLQQLSSGSRINSGADDAAGLSLANGLQASSTALSQSAKNASEGVDFLQVADGALSQVTSLLNRAVTLATEASNGTLNASQQGAANAEYQKILGEINTINANTEYNGIHVFRQNSGSAGVSIFTSDGTVPSSYNNQSTDLVQADGATLNLNSAQNLAITATLKSGDVTASDLTAAAAVSVSDSAGVNHNVNVSFTQAGANTWTYALSTDAPGIAAGVTLQNGTGTLTFDPTTHALTSNSGGVATISVNGANSAPINLNFSAVMTGAAAGIPTLLVAATGSSTDLMNAANAATALGRITTAISAIASDRGTIGANINTLTAVGNVMTMQSTNTLAAENDVTATDYGQATSDMSKFQILSQTGIAALSQANQSQQLITKLLQ